MTAKEILELELEDPESRIKDSIGNYIRDVIDGILCDEIYGDICEERGLREEDTINYSFYDDPIWKDAWNKKVDEIADVLKL